MKQMVAAGMLLALNSAHAATQTVDCGRLLDVQKGVWRERVSIVIENGSVVSVGPMTQQAGNIDLSRTGVGVEYLQGRWRASAELHQADKGRYRTGLALGVDWRASDSWRFSARFDSNSLDTPWKARLANVGARSAELGATYVVNESRAFEARYQRMDFSDGNARDGFGLRMQHATGELNDTARLGTSKRDLARALTIAKQRGLDLNTKKTATNG